MHERLVNLLACPVCRKSLVFEGKKKDQRLVSGYLKCSFGHIYQIKEEIGFLKDAKLSANEFKWKIDVADEKRYNEIRRQYDSYLREDQKFAIGKLMRRLVDLVADSSKADNMVLDIATGMGTFLLQMARRSSQGLLIIGTDTDDKPLRGAMNIAKKANVWHKLSLLVADAKHLAFKNGVLSTISSHFGFDNVPEAVSAFKETARVLRSGGNIFLSSLWFREDSESMRLAEKHQVCQIASQSRLKKALDEAGLALERVEEVYSGVWPYNPMDLLPVEGDEYKHVIVQVKKQRS